MGSFRIQVERKKSKRMTETFSTGQTDRSYCGCQFAHLQFGGTWEPYQSDEHLKNPSCTLLSLATLLHLPQMLLTIIACDCSMGKEESVRGLRAGNRANGQVILPCCIRLCCDPVHPLILGWIFGRAAVSLDCFYDTRKLLSSFVQNICLALKQECNGQVQRETRGFSLCVCSVCVSWVDIKTLCAYLRLTGIF